MPPSRSHLRQGELRGGRWIFQARSSGIWPRSSISRGCCCQTKSCGSRAAETEKQGKMSRRPAEASYTGTSCSAGKYSCTFIQSLVALLSRQRRLLPNTISWRQSSRDGEAGGKMSLRPAEAISAEASCSAGVGLFMCVHPAFSRAPVSPEAAAAKQNLVEVEQQRRRSRGRCRSIHQKPSAPKRAARRAFDFSCAFIRHLAAFLSRQRLLLPNKIS